MGIGWRELLIVLLIVEGRRDRTTPATAEADRHGR